MDKGNLALELELRQDFRDVADLSNTQSDEVSLSGADRRLLLGASIRLFSRRFSCGQPIFQDDLQRVVLLADDAVEVAA